MLLKKLRMVGFKSFADETVIMPEDGITAVVGPNGCGKSNIVDAVRWVLGEKSGRALRGKSMEDVIFLGSESRKQAGMAEVELTFDNADRALPLDQDEVTIGRRIYLSSSSDYLLNGRKTTRRELEKIFMDTGIGKTAYSIMEQGRMAEILKASADERRNLFDEAAGVSRFKAERAETLSRLQDTDQNLQRLDDILKSKKEEIEHLERQARKTRSYLKLKEHLDRHDKSLRYINYLKLEEKKKKTDEKLAALSRKRDEVNQRITERERNTESAELENEKRTESVHNLDREFHRDLSRMDSINESLQRIGREKEERNAKLKTLRDRKSGEERIYKEIQARLQASMQLELDIEAEMKSLQSAADSITANIEKLKNEIQASAHQEDLNQKELASIDEKQAAVLEELKDVTHDLIVELEARKKEAGERESRRTELRTLIKNHLEEIQKKLASGSASGDIPEKLSEVSSLFSEYESIDDDLRSFLFGKSGLLAKKEELDQRAGDLQVRRETLNKENHHLQEKRKIDQSWLEKEKNRRVDLEFQIRAFQVKTESSREAREQILSQQRESEERLAYYEREVEGILSDADRQEQEESAFKKEKESIEAETRRQREEMESIQKVIEKSRQEIHSMKEESRRDRETLEKMIPEITEQERQAGHISVSITGLQEELYNDFQLSLGELISDCEKLNLRPEHEESEYRRIKGEIVALGQFNALAIEELERAGHSYEELMKQRSDIEEARKNIMNLLNEIDEKSKERFIAVFAQIQENFTSVFQKLFNGGNATLSLSDPSDPMNTGVDIMVQPPGKKNSSITLLSGGEQNMTAIALMFATYLVRPSPFCLLDEIDAPLDDTNVNRFLSMLSEFAQKSQFLMITHNKLSMMHSKAIFGVTQEIPGISKIVSVKLGEGQHVRL